MPEFKSVLAPWIESFIVEKQAVGYKYQEETRSMRRFDDFCIAREHSEPALTKELVWAWARKREHESDKSQRTRACTIRQFGKYLMRIGQPAYVYPIGVDRPVQKKFVPYIFSEKELAAFFSQVDQCQPIATSPQRHLVLPLLFRMLYGCGLRISEALALKVSDVNLQDGVLTIAGSKFGKDRIVPLCSSLHVKCLEYAEQVHGRSGQDAPFFPTSHEKSLHMRCAYAYYRRFLWAADISHGGRGKGPRLHDLRHTFAVHSLKRFVANGDDLLAMLPRLSAYLGHIGLDSTQHYLRLCADVFPQVAASVENTFGSMIPEVTVYE